MLDRGLARALLGRILLVLALACAVAAAAASIAGGFRFWIAGARVSVGSAGRAALLAVVFATVGLWLDEQTRNAARRIRMDAIMRVIAVAVAAAVLTVGLVYGTKAAGGADVHGYVSQARLWLAGDLRADIPLAAQAPWPDAAASFAPLGYVAADRDTIVPSYAPGIPMLMALLMLAFGSGAEYWLTPLCGGALVLLTYAVGARVSGTVVGTAAALCIATSPIVLYMTCWLLGDLPGAAFWTASLWLALRASTLSAAASGLAAGVAILIRPNLVPLAVVPLYLSAFLPPIASSRVRVTRLAAFAIASAPAVFFIGWLFDHLYGSPLHSGYGPTGSLYALSNLAINLERYPRWIVESHGPFVFLFPLSVIVALIRRSDWRIRPALLAFIVLVFASYVAYSVFDDWWYIRFLLPAFPIMFVLAVDGLWNVAGASGRVRGYLAVAVFTAAVVTVQMRESLEWGVTAIGASEQKYAHVGDFVATQLPQNAVIYSMQHSGNIRHYSGRLTIRWDVLPPEWLDASIEHMRRQGYRPYYVLDDWELPLFEQRFHTQRAAQVVHLEAAAERRTYNTFLYRVDEEPGVARVVRLPMPTKE